MSLKDAVSKIESYSLLGKRKFPQRNVPLYMLREILEAYDKQDLPKASEVRNLYNQDYIDHVLEPILRWATDLSWIHRDETSTQAIEETLRRAGKIK